MSKLICFRLNDRAYQRLMRMNVSPQRLSQYLVDSWLNEHEDDIGVLFTIYAIESKIAKISEQIIHADQLKLLKGDLENELAVYKSQYKDELGYVELHHLLQYLNKKIIIYQYKQSDIEKKQGDIIKLIKEHDPEFNLEEQIKMVKKLRSDFII